MDSFEFDEGKHLYTLNGKKLMSVTEIVSMINGDKFAINESVLRQAQQRGTAVHELTAMFDNDIENIEVDAGLEGYFTGWQRFCSDYRPEWLFVERKLYSDSLMTAGTVDRIGIIDGKAVIVDIKTSSSLDRVSQIGLFMQIAGYSFLLDCNQEKADLSNSMGVQLLNDGTYKTYRYKDAIEKYRIDFKHLFVESASILGSVKGLLNGEFISSN